VFSFSSILWEYTPCDSAVPFYTTTMPPSNVPRRVPFLLLLSLFGVVLVGKKYATVRILEDIVHQDASPPSVATAPAKTTSSEAVGPATGAGSQKEKENQAETVAADSVQVALKTKEWQEAEKAFETPKIEAAVNLLDEDEAPMVISTEDGNRVLNASSVNIKIPCPVFAASLYKSGTTTIHGYFQCGLQKSVHYANGRTRTAPCLEKRIRNGLHPVFQGCGGDMFDIYTDNANLKPPKSCFDPSVHGLDAIYESYPNATILLAVRSTQKWFDSVDRYRFRNWRLLSDLKQCPDLWPTQQQDIGNRTLTDDDIKNFYDWHTEHVRNFAKNHPSMTYVEISLESKETGQILEDAVGIPSQCWGHANINTRVKSTNK